MSGKPLPKREENWLDKLHNGTDVVSSVGFVLEQMAYDFQAVGNETICQKLIRQSERLQVSAKNIRESAGEAITEQFNRSQESSNNMLLAALASTAQTLEATGDKKGAQTVAKAGVAIGKKPSHKKRARKTKTRK